MQCSSVSAVGVLCLVPTQREQGAPTSTLSRAELKAILVRVPDCKPTYNEQSWLL